MFKAKIYGAGSIGAHYANSLVNNGFKVYVYDISSEALERFKNKLYPERYGSFNKKINLLKKDDLSISYDLILIGTPPMSHFKILEKNINNGSKIIHVEKPLCTSFNDDTKKFEKLINLKKKSKIFVGYNHVLTPVCQKSIKLLNEKKFGKLMYIESETKEHWDNIFNAHFWLKKVSDSYLGNFKQGGGSLHEHSHALHLAYFFLKKISPKDEFDKLFCNMTFQKGHKYIYDDVTNIQLLTKNKIPVSVHQDLISKKSSKKLHLEFEKGYLTISINVKKNTDMIEYFLKGSKIKKINIKKTRSDDFLGTVSNYKRYLRNQNYSRDLNLEESVNIMKIIKACFVSNQKNKVVKLFN